MAEADREGRGRPAAGTRDDLGRRSLASHFGELARALQTHHDPVDTVAAVLDAVVRDVPGAQHASMSVVDRKRGVHTIDATSDLARCVDQIQYDTQQGPCLDSLREHVTVRADQLDVEDRWPRFAWKATAAGVHSMLSVQVFTDEEDLGALNMFHERPRAFTDESERIALAIASHAAVAVATAREIRSLQAAVASRGAIGEAKGMLMERYRLDAGVAFAVMVRYSRDNNVKLVDLARRITDRDDLEPPLAEARTQTPFRSPRQASDLSRVDVGHERTSSP